MTVYEETGNGDDFVVPEDATWTLKKLDLTYISRDFVTWTATCKKCGKTFPNFKKPIKAATYMDKRHKC